MEVDLFFFWVFAKNMKINVQEVTFKEREREKNLSNISEYLCI